LIKNLSSWIPDILHTGVCVVQANECVFVFVCVRVLMAQLAIYSAQFISDPGYVNPTFFDLLACNLCVTQVHTRGLRAGLKVYAAKTFAT